MQNEQFEDLVQLEALRNRIATGVYRTLISCTVKERFPEYLLENSSMYFSTGLVFLLSYGSNFTNDYLHTRHLKAEPKSLGCGALREDVEHVIEFCELYQNERNELKEQLEKNVEGIQEKFTLMEIILNSAGYSKKMRTKKTNRRR